MKRIFSAKNLILLGLSLLALLLAYLSAQRQRPYDASCVQEVISARAYGRYMHPIVSGGRDFKVHVGYHTCNPLQIGDVVYIQVETRAAPVPRLVRAVSGDKIEVVKGNKNKHWNMQVNGQLITYLPDNPMAFYFGDTQKELLLQKQLSASANMVPKEKIVATANLPPGAMDSTSHGLISFEQIIGWVEPPSSPR